MADNLDTQQHLQQLLSAARGALEEALEYAQKHDLWFEFTGIRRGPNTDGYCTLDVNDPEAVSIVEADRREYGVKIPKAGVDVLNLAEEWVGSWC